MLFIALQFSSNLLLIHARKINLLSGAGLSGQPSSRPSRLPSFNPSLFPTREPSSKPSRPPTGQPSIKTQRPTGEPSVKPSFRPTREPSSKPQRPTGEPSAKPSFRPTREPSSKPQRPTGEPSVKPSFRPTREPSSKPQRPTGEPSGDLLVILQESPEFQVNLRGNHLDNHQKYQLHNPLANHQDNRLLNLQYPQDNRQPSPVDNRRVNRQASHLLNHLDNQAGDPRDNQRYYHQGSLQLPQLDSQVGSLQPSSQPSGQPSSEPTIPTGQPSGQPSGQPVGQPTGQPSGQPSGQPTSVPTVYPTVVCQALMYVSTAFNDARGVAMDGSGNLYIADTLNNRVRVITYTGNFVRNVGIPGTFNQPSGIALDISGNVYVTDTLNNVIKIMTSAGTATATLGPIINGFTLASPYGIAVGDALTPDIYVTDISYLYKILGPSYTTVGYRVPFRAASGIALSPNGLLLYVADTTSNQIVVVRPSDGTILNNFRVAGLTSPLDVAVGIDGNVAVTSTGNYHLYLISPNGNSIRRWPAPTLSYQNISSVVVDSTGYLYVLTDHTANRRHRLQNFNGTAGIAVDSSGNIFVADSKNPLNKVHKISAIDSTVSEIGSLSVPSFNQPRGIAVDSNGNIFIADTFNNLVRMVKPTNYNTAVTIGASVTFNKPSGVAVDLSITEIYFDDIGQTVLDI
eukprot:gene3164-6244_t